MIVKGTEKIRGCLVLADPRLELKRGQQFRLSDDAMNKPEVVTAIAAGYLQLVEDVRPVVQPSDTNDILCKNNSKRPLGFNFFPREIGPGEEFSLTAQQLNEPEVSEGISNGTIGIVSKQKEATVNVQSLLQQAATKSAPVLDTNEEISTPAGVVKKVAYQNVIDVPNPDPVVSVDVPGRKAVVWNPGRTPMQTSPQKATEIGFVDKEQEAKRVAEHPILKDKPLSESPAVAFVDQQETTRNSSPSSATKPSDVCDVDI